MQSFQNILIYHTAAIGDTVLSTPTVALLRKRFPLAHITQISHSANLDLLALSGNIDRLFAYEQLSGWFQQRRYIVNLKPDLIVDLSGSLKSRVITQIHKARTLCYRKQPLSQRPVVHAVDNFLDTLAPLMLGRPSKLFPTLTIPPDLNSTVIRKTGAASDMVACVPGVGKLRSHRAWSKSKWIAMVQRLLEHKKFPVLIGGHDEIELCAEIAQATGVLNLAGSLSLCETAAVLRLCELSVSGDTGPAHIAIAVGTPVVGLYGPTYVERSGPYGLEHRCISATADCSCVGLKGCTVTGRPGPGYCMEQITVEDVMRKVLDYR